MFYMYILIFIYGWYTEESWRRFNGYILRHWLHRVHKIMEQIENEEKYTYGGISVRQGNGHEKAYIKLSKHFKMRRVAT